MSESATLSTLIDPDVKKAVVQFCKRRGIKIRHLVEQALVEQLEDEMDLEAFRQRKNEDTIPLHKILGEYSKKNSKKK